MTIHYADKTVCYIPNPDVQETTTVFDSPDNPLWNSTWFRNLIGETDEPQAS